MAHRLLLFVATVLVVLTAQAQDCIPDQTITQSGFSPKQIDAAMVGEPYKQVLQIRVFSDTVINVGGNPTLALIDSIRVNDIIGLPTGFYYTCSRKNCSFIPDSTGCSVLFGNPTANQIGEYPLGIAIQVFAKVFNLPSSQKDTLDQFTVVISDGSFVIRERTEDFAVYPNPSQNGSFHLDHALYQKVSKIDVTDLNGKHISVVQNDQDIQIDAVEGIFIARFTLTNGNIVTKRLLVMN